MSDYFIPTSGCTQYPQMVFYSAHNPLMDISAIISRNLNSWMESYPGRETLAKVAKAANIGFGTVQRARNGDGNITVSSLEAIAKAFRRTARDLITEPIDHDYSNSAPISVIVAREPSTEERTLLQGYRDASPDVQEMLLEIARKATQKVDFGPRSEEGG